MESTIIKKKSIQILWLLDYENWVIMQNLLTISVTLMANHCCCCCMLSNSWYWDTKGKREPKTTVRHVETFVGWRIKETQWLISHQFLDSYKGLSPWSIKHTPIDKPLPCLHHRDWMDSAATNTIYLNVNHFDPQQTSLSQTILAFSDFESIDRRWQNLKNNNKNNHPTTV